MEGERKEGKVRGRQKAENRVAELQIIDLILITRKKNIRKIRLENKVVKLTNKKNWSVDFMIL